MPLLYADILPSTLTIDDLINEVKTYRPADTEMIKLAYDFAADAHQGQLRKSGEPYIVHPLAAAFLLAKLKIDPSLVVGALLHDVPEDTQVTIEEIEKNFGADTAAMLRGVTKLGKLKYRGVERYIENLRKMFVAMAEDVRVMIIKFADRVHNLSTLDALPKEKRQRVAMESMEIYAPIANRLGMAEFKGMLEDLSFQHLHPKEFSRVKEMRDKFLAGQEAYLEKIMGMIRAELSKNGVRVLDVHGRKKQLYSLYQKLVKKGWEKEQVYDIIALRIIVEDMSDCYAALGIVHKLWRPLKGRVKDYIAQPKPNGYRSLHTTVFAEDGRVVEFQIRTKAMHEEAEYGVGAHWHYDERGAKLPAKDIGWAKELAKIQQEVLVNLSDVDELKVDFFQNRIFVFTPRGDVIDLPENATPIDFAYHIHSEIGNKCSGVRVNDQLVSLDTPLKSGDVVAVITDKNRKGASPDWLKIVKTHHAKTHIKSSLKNTSLNNWLKYILPKKK